MLLVIDMLVGQILVWDSMIALTSGVNIAKELKNMQTINFVALLEKVSVLVAKPNLLVTP